MRPATLQFEGLDRHFQHEFTRATDDVDDNEAKRREHQLADGENPGKQEQEGDFDQPKQLSWKQRMQHVTWAWFTLTMATGGIANVLHNGESSKSTQGASAK